MKLVIYFVNKKNQQSDIYDITNPEKLTKRIFALCIILIFICTPLLFAFNGALPLVPSSLKVESPIVSTPNSTPISDSIDSNNPSVNTRFYGVRQITTLWIKDECRYNTLLAQIFILNLTRIDINQLIIPISIYWELYDYQGNFITQTNTTNVSISRCFEDRTTMFYKITVFINESFGVCSFTTKKFYTLRFVNGSSQNHNDNPGSNLIPIASDNIPTTLSNAADILQIISSPLDAYILIELIYRFRKYLLKIRKQKKKLQTKKEGANDDFNKYLSYI